MCGKMNMKAVSEREFRYLSALKKLGEKKVRLKDLANELQVSTPSAHEEIGHLSSKGLVTTTQGFVSLTNEGNEAMEALKCAHFAFETIFAKYGFGEEEACAASHSFDYAVPVEIAQKLYLLLGRPTHCPAGRLNC